MKILSTSHELFMSFSFHIPAVYFDMIGLGAHSAEESLVHKIDIITGVKAMPFFCISQSLVYIKCSECNGAQFYWTILVVSYTL